MNKTLSIALSVAMSAPLAAVAAPAFYGKANVSLENQDVSVGATDTTVVALESNASRLGVKGSEALTDSNLEVIYQAEFEIAIDDGDNKGQTFTQRNIFVGVKGGFGTVQTGHFDTPFKSVQNKVDLFNDLKGDIKNIVSKDEVRASNSVMYTSPSFAGFTIFADVISSEVDKVSNAASVAVTFDKSGFYGAVAYDSKVTGINPGSVKDTSSAVRGVFQYTINNLQLGLLAEQYEPATNADKVNGSFISVRYTIDQWALLGQFGKSDIVKGADNDAKTFSVGADFNLSKNAKIFGFYTNNSFLSVNAAVAPKIDNDQKYAGVGMEVKF